LSLAGTPLLPHMTAASIPQTRIRYRNSSLLSADHVPVNKPTPPPFSQVCKQLREDLLGPGAAPLYCKRGFDLILRDHSTLGTVCSFAKWMRAHIENIRPKYIREYAREGRDLTFYSQEEA
jgi:hypothetical protein